MLAAHSHGSLRVNVFAIDPYASCSAPTTTRPLFLAIGERLSARDLSLRDRVKLSNAIETRHNSERVSIGRERARNQPIRRRMDDITDFVHDRQIKHASDSSARDREQIDAVRRKRKFVDSTRQPRERVLQFQLRHRVEPHYALSCPAREPISARRELNAGNMANSWSTNQRFVSDKTPEMYGKVAINN